MSDAAAPSPETTRRLRQLRLRITLLISLLATLIVAVFAVVVIRLDQDLRAEQFEAALLRDTDRVMRSLAFEDGQLLPPDPSDLLDESTAIGVRDEFDVFEFIEAEGLEEEFVEPTDEQFEFYVEVAFFGLDDEFQDELLVVFTPVELPRDERIERLLTDPPDDLIDEALRLYLFDAAEAAGVELEPATDIFRTQDGVLDEERVAEAVAVVVDEEASDSFEVADEVGNTIVVRGVVLRDGPEARGAVIAAADPDERDAAGRRLRARVIAVAVVLVVGSALAAWFVAGRTIRPTAAALQQQERFLADAAHELRTPIAAIRATAEAPLDEGEAAGERLDDVVRLATGASALTDDLLTLARIDADRLELRTEAVRLDLLVESVLDGDERFRLDAHDAVVDIDQPLVERALRNLFDNAVEHGGASADRPADVVVRDHTVTVTDAGDGFGDVEPERLFDRFHTGAASRGHGLGLPLARWIARAHGGDLVADRTDDGATFTLRLGR